MESALRLFTLHPRPPFRLDFTVFALRRNVVNVVDRWEAPLYRRLFVFDGRPVEVVVQQTAPPDTPELAVSLTGRNAGRKLDEDVTTSAARTSYSACSTCRSVPTLTRRQASSSGGVHARASSTSTFFSTASRGRGTRHARSLDSTVFYTREHRLVAARVVGYRPVLRSSSSG